MQPVELARKLAKEMDAHKTAGVARVYVPNEYTVYLSKQDRASWRATSARSSRSSPATCSITRAAAATTF